MRTSPRRGYKLVLLALTLLLFVGVSQVQKSMNRQRTDPELGLTRHTDLGTNAPPALAFTTVALGSFRGLIANALWIRANDLQMEGKYFEMVQLADWITKLEPHFAQVWLVQAWNMAYNISVKFSDHADRWRWVQSGIALLRDDGLRYNPKEALIYRELGWFFQHKMGQNLDDAHVFYKLAWSTNMTEVLGAGRPDFDQLIQPANDDARRRADMLRTRYKMEPSIMKEVDTQYGPLEWRLPEAHAIYWASVGLQRSHKKDLIMLRRVIYQSMHQAVLQGRLFVYSSNAPAMFGPNLDIAARANEAYEQMIRDDLEARDAIKLAHKNFLKETVYLCYAHNRLADANRYLDLIRQNYPEAIPAGISVDRYSLEMLAANITTLSHSQTKTIIEGLLRQSLIARALGDDDNADGLYGMARQLRKLYLETIGTQTGRLGLEELNILSKPVLDQLLHPETGLKPELAARLRTALNLPAPTPPAEVKP